MDCTVLRNSSVCCENIKISIALHCYSSVLKYFTNKKINLQKPPCKLRGFYPVYNPGYKALTFRQIILSNLGTH